MLWAHSLMTRGKVEIKIWGLFLCGEYPVQDTCRVPARNSSQAPTSWGPIGFKRSPEVFNGCKRTMSLSCHQPYSAAIRCNIPSFLPVETYELTIPQSLQWLQEDNVRFLLRLTSQTR